MALSQRTVLVADDSPTIRQVLCGVFEAGGFSVCNEASNGADAIEKAGQSQPDLVVLDLSMPGTNGLQAARAIRRTLPTTPIILFTMYAESVRTKDAMEAGVTTVLSKSDISVLISEAKACLSG